MAFKNLFLRGYSGVDEDDYSIAVYTKQNVYDSLSYVVDQVCICFSFILLFFSMFVFSFHHFICIVKCNCVCCVGQFSLS